MTKIGVGVGEDFPIEDRPPSGGGEDLPGASSGEAGQGAQDPSGPGPHEYDASRDHRFAGCGPGGWDREAWRAHRADWRRNRGQWKAEHREWRRRFKAEMRARVRNGEIPFPFFPFVFPLIPILIGFSVLALLITGLVTIVASAPFVVLGLALLFVLYAAHKRHYHHHDYRYYDATPTDAPQSSPPPAEGH